MPDRAVITVAVDAEAATREQAYRDKVLSGRAPALKQPVQAEELAPSTR